MLREFIMNKILLFKINNILLRRRKIIWSAAVVIGKVGIKNSIIHETSKHTHQIYAYDERLAFHINPRIQSQAPKSQA